MVLNVLEDKNGVSMIKKKALYSYFFAAFHKSSQEYGYGFKSYLERKGCMSAAFATMILKGHRKASVKKQKLIAKACGYDYDDYLALGKSILQNNNTIHKAVNSIGVKSEILNQAYDYLVQLEYLSQEEFLEFFNQLKKAVHRLEQTKAMAG